MTPFEDLPVEKKGQEDVEGNGVLQSGVYMLEEGEREGHYHLESFAQVAVNKKTYLDTGGCILAAGQEESKHQQALKALKDSTKVHDSINYGFSDLLARSLGSTGGTPGSSGNAVEPPVDDSGSSSDDLEGANAYNVLQATFSRKAAAKATSGSAKQTPARATPAKATSGSASQSAIAIAIPKAKPPPECTSPEDSPRSAQDESTGGAKKRGRPSRPLATLTAKANEAKDTRAVVLSKLQERLVAVSTLPDVFDPEVADDVAKYNKIAPTRRASSEGLLYRLLPWKPNARNTLSSTPRAPMTRTLLGSSASARSWWGSPRRSCRSTSWLKEKQ